MNDSKIRERQIKHAGLMWMQIDNHGLNEKGSKTETMTWGSDHDTIRSHYSFAMK